MDSRFIAGAALACVIVLVLAWQIYLPLRRRRQREALLRGPMPAQWREWLMQDFALYAHVPPDLRARLDGLIQVFVAQKRFVGCAGQDVTQRMRVVIAAQACLLIANRRGGVYDTLHTVLVYPQAFYVEHEQMDEHGLVSQDRRLLSGESWSDGQVVVSWDDAKRGGAHGSDGHNVLLHEFAHQLDGQSGSVNGAPMLEDEQDQSLWARTMREEYGRLNQSLARGEQTLIDPYGATHPAEFFAVLSEVFFEQPRALRDEHPALYQRLREYYHVDPAMWR